MALNTHSKFYYGWQVTIQNRYIDFHDGINPLTAILDVGYYSSQTLANEVVKKMNALSPLDFVVSFNRVTRAFTIASTANFELRFGTGTFSAQSAASLLGFTATNKTGALSYAGSLQSGLQYSTQFHIQSYKDTSMNRKAIDGVINKSASGVTEVIKFGNERFMDAEFLFITNMSQEASSIVRTNKTGVEDFIQFIEWCTEKAIVEFMVNENDQNSFQQFVLESTEQDAKGLDYELVELYDRGLPLYYKSGKLKFRLTE